MKVCFFTENYYKGGLDTFLINLMSAWPDRGDNLTLVCNASHPGIDHINAETLRHINFVQYHRFFTSKFSKGTIPFSNLQSPIIGFLFKLVYQFIQYPILLPWYIVSLTIFFNKSSFDRMMVVNGGYPASLLCRCAIIAWSLSNKKKYLAILNIHSQALRPSWYFYLPEYLIDVMVFRSSKSVISVSKDCLKTIYNRPASKFIKNMYYIYNGIKDPGISSKTLYWGDESNDSHPKCLMLSTYERHKGHEFALRAFSTVLKSVPNAEFHMYGYGTSTDRDRINNYISILNLKNNAFLHKFNSNTGVLYSEASVIFVPSQVYESFGLTIIEAMSYGIPIIASDIGGIPEVLNSSKSGYVFPVHDQKEFSNLIVNLLKDKEDWLRLSKNGRKAFKKSYIASSMSCRYHYYISLV